ncbi:glycosyltransferase family 2 protein [Paenibacillus sp. NPDC057967]|uniref:glycosyltransferase family 2 protein n=1 Tax=Paenibacillus sp. NPDC057967 TaxID=3346293 RepID=UPI0036D8C50C
MHTSSVSARRPKVSVIIPLYNAEAYLPACIDSLLAQTLANCEFIFVDDGSRDRSAEILERYRERDQRIVVIQQANAGVSAARNAGLAAARGEFVGFVDADDWAAPELFGTLYAAAADGDVVYSGYMRSAGGKESVIHGPFLTGVRMDQAYLREWVLPVFVESDSCNSVCNKLYRKEIIDTYGLSFPQSVALGEDGLFNMRFLCYARGGICLDYAGYYYRETEGSATRRTESVDYFARTLEVYQSELPDDVMAALDKEKLEPLKLNKFVRSAISIIHAYYSASTPVSFSQKYRYVRTLLNQWLLREALERYKGLNEERMGRYERVLIRLMLLRSPLGLYCITAYSNARNKG